MLYSHMYCILQQINHHPFAGMQFLRLLVEFPWGGLLVRSCPFIEVRTTVSRFFHLPLQQSSLSLEFQHLLMLPQQQLFLHIEFLLQQRDFDFNTDFERGNLNENYAFQCFSSYFADFSRTAIETWSILSL